MDRDKIFYKEGDPEELDLLKDKKKKNSKLPLLTRLGLVGSTILLGATTALNLGGQRGEMTASAKQTTEQEQGSRPEFIDTSHSLSREYLESHHLVALVSRENLVYFKSRQDMLTGNNPQYTSAPALRNEGIPVDSLVFGDNRMPEGAEITIPIGDGTETVSGFFPLSEQIGLRGVNIPPTGSVRVHGGKSK
ncbi:MAG TPA: hypothetical protein VLH19_02515 [Patescibacteria group bacterium]|nr:hypothetical protein [Patescibacteria group bacterium]